MKPIKTENSNHNFGPPEGKEGEIDDLPCRIHHEPSGERYIYSIWELSDEERAAIASGLNIELGVGWIGGYPPTSLEVTYEGMIQPSRRTPNKRWKLHLRALINWTHGYKWSCIKRDRKTGHTIYDYRN